VHLDHNPLLKKVAQVVSVALEAGEDAVIVDRKLLFLTERLLYLRHIFVGPLLIPNVRVSVWCLTGDN
jgi:hypothetical protein